MTYAWVDYFDIIFARDDNNEFIPKINHLILKMNAAANMVWFKLYSGFRVVMLGTISIYCVPPSLMINMLGLILPINTTRFMSSSWSYTIES